MTPWAPPETYENLGAGCAPSPCLNHSPLAALRSCRAPQGHPALPHGLSGPGGWVGVRLIALTFSFLSALLIAVSTAVDKVIAHFSSARNLVQKVRAQLGWVEGRRGSGGFGSGSVFHHTPVPHLWSSEGALREGSHYLLPPFSPCLYTLLPLAFRLSWGTAGSALTWATCCCTPCALRSMVWWRTG